MDGVDMHWLMFMVLVVFAFGFFAGGLFREYIAAVRDPVMAFPKESKDERSLLEMDIDRVVSAAERRLQFMHSSKDGGDGESKEERA